MSSVHGIKCSWNFNNTTEDDINSRTNELIAKCRAVYDQIGEMNFEQVTFENVIKKLADVDCEFSTYRSPLEFPQHVSIIKELRNASTAASQKLEGFDVEMSMRKDVFDKIVYFQEKRQMDSLEPEAKRYVESLIKIGYRNGLQLPHQVQLEIMGLKKRMNELCINFQANLNEENTTLEFTEMELEGLSEDFIQNLEKLDNGKRRVTMKNPHFFPIIRKCQIAQTRFTVDKAYHSRCMTENVPILEELIKLRQQHADLLGYATHSDYITEVRMAKTAETVAKFLDDLKVKLLPLWVKEKAIMLDFKKRECEALGVEFDGEIHYWDFRYYMIMVAEQLFAVDQNKLKEYFPLHVVTEGLLDIYQHLLGLTFEEMTNDCAWHPDVQVYSVKDATNEAKALLGYFFLDLFPREGKYGHAAVFELQVGCLDADNKHQLKVAAMLTNFTKPTQDKPSLLDHKEVETYFHEFGHVMHQICAHTHYAMFSGLKVERDFVEAPSQMLQNWVWEPEPLKRMSSHYKTNVPLPDDMIAKLVFSTKVNAGIFNLRQIILAKFDQMIHTVGEANTQELFNKLFQEIVGIPAIEGTNMAATFGHLAGGYDAQYYGYLWSQVYSCDMFASRFKREGIMNAGVGLNYRCCILEPGGSLDAEVMIENFLGRPPTQDAFLESIGVNY